MFLCRTGYFFSKWRGKRERTGRGGESEKGKKNQKFRRGLSLKGKRLDPLDKPAKENKRG